MNRSKVKSKPNKRKIEDVDTNNAQLSRIKTSTQQRIDELRRQLDEETKAKNSLAHELQGQRRDNEMLKVYLLLLN